MSRPCPSCGAPGLQVLFCGLPLYLCPDEDCSRLWGGWCWLASRLPFNGIFVVYTGSYWPALWRWLKGEEG